MNKQATAVRGVIVPLITPVDENARVDEAGFRKVIRHCIAGGADGLFVGGSAGMGPMLEEAEWRRAVEIAAEETAGRACLMGGVIETSTTRALRKIRLLEQAGIKVMVVTPTFYITLAREQEFLAHFRACREATALEMVAYNIPGCTNSTVPVGVIRRLCEEGWISAIKESSGDREYFSKLLALAQEFGVNLLQGNEPDIAWGLERGAAGIVPVCANYEPETFAAAVRAAGDGRLNELGKIQKRIDEVRANLLVGDHNWIAGIMYGMSTLGMGSGRPLAPLQEVPEERKRIIEGMLAARD